MRVLPLDIFKAISMLGVNTDMGWLETTVTTVDSQATDGDSVQYLPFTGVLANFRQLDQLKSRSERASGRTNHECARDREPSSAMALNNSRLSAK